MLNAIENLPNKRRGFVLAEKFMGTHVIEELSAGNSKQKIANLCKKSYCSQFQNQNDFVGRLKHLEMHYAVNEGKLFSLLIHLIQFNDVGMPANSPQNLNLALNVHP